KSIGVERPLHAIFMLDEPDVIRRKVARAQTDAQPAVTPPVGPGVANLIDMYAALAGIDGELALAEFTGKPYSALKSATSDAIIAALTPVQQRYAELRGDEAGLRAVLARSAARVTPVAGATLNRVMTAVGLR